MRPVVNEGSPNIPKLLLAESKAQQKESTTLLARHHTDSEFELILLQNFFAWWPPLLFLVRKFLNTFLDVMVVSPFSIYQVGSIAEVLDDPSK
jgi:hypothetical protein